MMLYSLTKSTDLVVPDNLDIWINNLYSEWFVTLESCDKKKKKHMQVIESLGLCWWFGFECKWKNVQPIFTHVANLYLYLLRWIMCLFLFSFFARFWLKVQLEMILLETLPLMTFPSWTVNHMKVKDHSITEILNFLQQFYCSNCSEFPYFQFPLLICVFYRPLLQESSPNRMPQPLQWPPQPPQFSPTVALMESLCVGHMGSVLPTAKCVTSDKIVPMVQMN